MKPLASPATALVVLACLLPPAARAEGVLRVHPDNPRYFTDDTGRAIYLAGHQWFNDLQHNAWNFPVDVDWDRYLDFVRERNLNYLRNWIVWSVGDPTADRPTPLMPFARTGPGTALDGRPKFDLSRFDPAFFDRLRSQIRAAEKRGLYVSIMLFEVYGFMDRDHNPSRSFWAGSVLNDLNNVNRLDIDKNGDGHGMEFFFTDDPRILDIQKAYVRKIIDTVNEFDNVFYEIANELEAGAWQHDMIRFVKKVEATMPKQHLVYMSPGGRDRNGRWRRMPKAMVADAPADLYGVTKGWNQRYRGDPPVEPARKPVFMDMDHGAADNDGDNAWNNHPTTPWKLLTRAYHQCLFDHDYWKPGSNRAAWDLTRRNVGLTAALAAEIDLVAMNPRKDLASTGYCLANPGVEYVVFAPGKGPFTVQGLIPDRRYAFRWYDVSQARVDSRGFLRAAGAVQPFKAPAKDAALYLVLKDQTE